MGTDKSLTIERLLRSGNAWPISGDGIARTRAGIGACGLIGIVDWEAYLDC